ncbi:MAG: hypothetical protein VR74_08000 [Hyphomonas sp. BRH_c22]|uniref:hypothetical protein n=1 Tax=Hyphomonas sp. BRH_c22 TaxID=1629710 RepID=UPI0005F0DB09|nr:hypothetical protein [Hyphomonas sp. BRH_c22]KJS37667.1 MAG: hypothetical protein VR74_08000 [Hyphomonas sp. BRH_c22]
MIKTAYGLIICSIGVGLSAYGQEWIDLTTHTTLTNGKLCYTDGTDLICDSTTPAANAGGLNATQICDETGNNCKDVSGGWGASVSADSIDWSDISDAMTLDASTDIATGSNNLTINTDDVIIEGSSGNVGIGTSPTNARLDVAGAVKIADETDTCSSAADEGKIRYVSGEFAFCESASTGWQTIADIAPAAGGGGGGLLVAYDPDDELLGYYLTYVSGGVGFYYFYNPTTRDMVLLSTADLTNASPMTIDANVYFNGADCSGSIRGIDNTGSYPYGYSCTGATPCTTDVISRQGASTSARTYASKRNTAGVCVNETSSATVYISTSTSLVTISPICQIVSGGTVSSGCYLGSGG